MFPRIIADAWMQLSVRQTFPSSPPEEGEPDLRVETVTPKAIASTNSPNTARTRLTPARKKDTYMYLVSIHVGTCTHIPNSQG